MALCYSRRPLVQSLAFLLGVALLAIPLACDSPKSLSNDQGDDQAEQQSDTPTDTEGSSKTDSTPAEPSDGPENAASTENAAPDTGPPVDPFEIPEKGAEELFAFIDRVQETRPELIGNENPQETEARFIDHSKKIMGLVIEATQRVRAGDATDEEFAKALSFEHQALKHLSKIGDEAAASQAKQLIEDAKDDDRPYVLQVVVTGLFELAGKGDEDALKSAAALLERLSKDNRPEILSLRLDSLFQLDSLGDQEARKKLKQLVGELEKDQRPEVAAMALRNSIRISSQEWDQLTDESKNRLMEDFQQVLTEGEFGNEQLNFGLAVAEGIELSGDKKAALESYQVLTRTMAGSGNQMLAMLAQQIAMMSGSLEWLDKDFEIFGTLVDGTPFDAKKYEGKLVLVDFWATWCGPCVQELPNVLAAYEKFHDQGFEVVGVSLDSEPEALENFIRLREIPWENIFGKDASERGYEHQMALKYEIQGIPATFLLDGQGKVIAVNLRGQKLDKILRQHLGEEKQAAGEENPEEAKTAPIPKAEPEDNKADGVKPEKPAEDSPEKKESDETPSQDTEDKAESKEESKKESSKEE